MPTYAFRIRFLLPPTMVVQSEEKVLSIEYPDAAIDLTLRALRVDELRNAHELVVKGTGFSDPMSAEKAGKECQQALMLMLTRIKLGADLGGGTHPQSVVTEYGLLVLEKQRGQSILNDVHGLMVYEEDIPILFVSASVEAKAGRSSSNLCRILHQCLKCRPGFSAKEHLAFELFGLSFFEQSERARFLTLMIAIEALLEPKDRSPLALEHVRSLISTTQDNPDLDKSEAASLSK